MAGAAAAVAAEVSMSLLLYAGPGLARSLTTVLTVQAAALSAGLWSAPVSSRPDLLEAVRRRWLLCLGAFVLATLYSAFWSVLEPVGGKALGQGMGLGLMAALPLYACGTVLGGMGSVAVVGGVAGVRSIGGAAFTGALLAFAATGVALPRALAPASLFLGCLILLSAAGLIWGGMLDRQLRVEVKVKRPSPWGEVRVEDRRLPAEEQSARVLVEGDHVRRWISTESTAVVPWDVSVLRGWASAEERSGRVLLVGGGASQLPVAAVRDFPGISVDVLERNPAVVELARDHLETGSSGESERLRLYTGNLEDLLEGLEPGGYDLVIVDGMSLGPLGGVRGVARGAYATLHGLVSGAGALAIGPMGSSRPLPSGWASATLRRTLGYPAGGLELEWPEEEQVLVAFPSASLPWLDAVEDFALDSEVPPAVPVPLPPAST